jgi:2-polyprenyl-3-methyl-5-hydroxy-6-metoxy-1,4-benzoquinol methylase
MSPDPLHWDEVYRRKDVESVSWFERSPETSLRLIRAATATGRTLVDVGAGASSVADLLVAEGYDVTVLDISEAALDLVRRRLAGRVSYVVSDVLAWTTTRRFDVWHDRAVFHFLVDPSDQRRYAALASKAVRPGGALVIGTFAPDGPTSCSGLPTARHDIDSLAGIFGRDFDVEQSEGEEHRTPWGAVQSFTWGILRRTG